jgi:hypothetical protein
MRTTSHVVAIEQIDGSYPMIVDLAMNEDVRTVEVKARCTEKSWLALQGYYRSGFGDDEPLVANERRKPVVEYRDVIGFPGYRVGDDGSVWSCRAPGGGFAAQWSKLSFSGRSSGYAIVYTGSCAGPKRRLMGHLVLEAFVGPRPPGMECCHFPDNDPSNNRLVNLRWDTHANNMQDKVCSGTQPRGESHCFAKVTESQVRDMRRVRRETGASYAAIGRRYGITASNACAIINRKTWTHI